ncbi:hypothetical protein TPHA_0A03980 [Tetrapisispora phaffii CBS 4417]|uniref:C2H2-type domain-containing protein n=1 Tax=Tetrapisispora phaffii (strain ATCC 24235 / CBS 4417 / NBRC 1672 / NRRL Y-8282 / UCD 70-5) TaxID=1071381 RepID=G8BNJ6_TETPH|nr:hypothetical protein TPHA_0A03980 [Tetrapisispora phaffii CBS 4417]CCE61474.1 hypothetical protein TPHA_0A03980 [Tetrapisispora phaffii CBS 4417]
MKTALNRDLFTNQDFSRNDSGNSIDPNNNVILTNSISISELTEYSMFPQRKLPFSYSYTSDTPIENYTVTPVSYTTSTSSKFGNNNSTRNSSSSTHSISSIRSGLDVFLGMSPVTTNYKSMNDTESTSFQQLNSTNILQQINGNIATLGNSNNSQLNKEISSSDKKKSTKNNSTTKLNKKPKTKKSTIKNNLLAKKKKKVNKKASKKISKKTKESKLEIKTEIKKLPNDFDPHTFSSIDDDELKLDPSQYDPKKKYICKVCSKGLTTSGHLARHYRIHTGEKNYSCLHEGCDQKFSRHDNCKQHYKTHLKNYTK